MGGGKQKKPKGETLTFDLEVSLEDLYNGATIEVCGGVVSAHRCSTWDHFQSFSHTCGATKHWL